MNTPALRSRLRPWAAMPGRLGKPAALLAAVVLFLAALPILTMILMSFSASVTLCDGLSKLGGLKPGMPPIEIGRASCRERVLVAV